MLRKEDIIDRTLKINDPITREILWGYLSGVDREGSNVKTDSEEMQIERTLKKLHPTEDACVLRLRAKYARSYE